MIELYFKDSYLIDTFEGTIAWLEIEGRYIPDVYHTVLHLLIIAVIVITIVYIKSTSKKANSNKTENM